MAPIKKTILHITPFFSPNIGGVETHLSDLTDTLSSQGYRNYILTYSPITTADTPYKPKEKPNQNLFIRRFTWIGGNLFHRLEPHPLLNFLYLTPYLLIRVFFWLLFHPVKFDAVHTHGLNAAVIGLVIKPIFGIPKHLVSIYSAYDAVPQSVSTKFLMRTILNHTNIVLTQSARSRVQLQNLGVDPNKLNIYRHWIDLGRFSPSPKTSKGQRFSVLFIGRLIPQKGALLLAKVAQDLPDIDFVFVGNGPDFSRLKKISQKTDNIHLVGNVPYHSLHQYYQRADVFCIPSLYEEGWGRVIMEAISCGKPVIASNLGAIPEVVDSTVAILVKPTLSQLKHAIQLLHQDRKLYHQMQKQCQPYAIKHFGPDNIRLIAKYY